MSLSFLLKSSGDKFSDGEMIFPFFLQLSLGYSVPTTLTPHYGHLSSPRWSRSSIQSQRKCALEDTTWCSVRSSHVEVKNLQRSYLNTIQGFGFDLVLLQHWWISNVGGMAWDVGKRWRHVVAVGVSAPQSVGFRFKTSPGMWSLHQLKICCFAVLLQNTITWQYSSQIVTP